MRTDWLQKEINQINAELVNVNQRLNEINEILRHDENLARLTQIRKYAGDLAGNFGDLTFRLSMTKDAAERQILAHEAFGLADNFLLEDPILRDIWNWTNLIVVRIYNDDHTFQDYGPVTRLDPDFNVAAVLPLYARVLMLCIAAIDKFRPRPRALWREFDASYPADRPDAGHTMEFSRPDQGPRLVQGNGGQHLR